jgi:hypothetical protein
MIQMPENDGNLTFAAAVAQRAPVLAGVRPREHPFLYTWDSVQKLLAEFGFRSLARYQPLFVYDMFFIASRQPLRQFTDPAIRQKLLHPKTLAAYAALKNYEALVAASNR